MAYEIKNMIEQTPMPAKEIRLLKFANNFLKTHKDWVIVVAVILAVGSYFFFQSEQVGPILPIERVEPISPSDCKCNIDGECITDLIVCFSAGDRFIDFERLKIANASSSTGFETGFNEYPKLTWVTNIIREHGPGVDIDIEYPQFTRYDSHVDQLNAYIADIVDKIIFEDRRLTKEYASEDFNSDLDGIHLGAQYRIIGVVDGVVSLELVVTDFTGGGNGNHDRPVIINWNLETNKILDSAKFYCSNDAKQKFGIVVRKYLVKYLGLEVADMWLDNVIGEELKESSILLSNNGVIVVFPPYSVSSGATGIVRILIPEEETKGLLCI